MPTINYSVTQSISTLAVNLSASEALVMNIDNPLIGASYFGLETIPDNNGVYTTSSPKNTSGSFTLGTGILGVVRDDYKMSAVVSPGSNVLTFVPAQAVTGSTLRTRGIAAPPLSTLFDPDAQAFFDRVTTAGGALTSTEQTAVNQLVLDMKSVGIWSVMKAIYPMVGASAAACAQNLKSSSFTGTFTSGWTFASTGATPNGTSAYMDTGFNPTLHLTNQIESHLSLYSRTQNSSKSSIDIGCYDVGLGKPFCASMYYNGVAQKFGGHKGGYPSDFTTINNTDTTGLLLSTRRTNTELNLFQDGVKLITNTTNVSPYDYPNLNCWVGGYLRTPSSPDQFSILQYAFASIGDGLTDTQASNFYTAVQAFQTTLSRQV